ncbi:2-hydroxyacyl-CoA dehydratase subunit D [Desulfosporosinus fructosivorans]
MKLHELLKRCEDVANNPNKYVIEWKAKTGRKAIGGVAPFPPDEIIYAAGALPVTMFGGAVAPTDAYKYFPQFYCSVVTTSLQLGIQGSYRELSAVVAGCCCDGLKDFVENWKSAVEIPIIDCIYPANRKLEAARVYFTKELRQASERIQAITGHKTTDLDLQHAITLHNEHRAVMREFAEVAVDHLDIFTPTVRHNVFKSALFMDKAEHLPLVRSLIDELKARPVYDFKGVRVISTGIIIDVPDILKMLEENNIAIVGDDVVQESKRYETDTPNGIDLYYQIATRWSNMEGSSLLFDVEKKRGTMLLDMLKNRKADGILYVLLKFCEIDEFDYPIMKQIFREAQVPELFLETENVYSNDQQAATRIQAFKEMVGK